MILRIECGHRGAADLLFEPEQIRVEAQVGIGDVHAAMHHAAAIEQLGVQRAGVVCQAGIKAGMRSHIVNLCTKRCPCSG